jgi:hypothetical protein
MPRGIQKFAWIILTLAIAGLLLVLFNFTEQNSKLDHALMGFFFGVLHLAYGIYLRVTGERKSTA